MGTEGLSECFLGGKLPLRGRTVDSTRAECPCQGPAFLVVFSHQWSVVYQLPEVVKERCLKMLHDKFFFVLVVSIVLNTAYMITETGEIAGKQ
jgi:hypothetical protein